MSELNFYRSNNFLSFPNQIYQETNINNDQHLNLSLQNLHEINISSYPNENQFEPLTNTNDISHIRSML